MPYHLAITQSKGGRWESNPRVPEPQSGALTTSPLSPSMAGVVGIEPTLTVLETVVLPLNYTPIIKNGREWIRTTEPEGADLQSAAFSQTSLPLHKWRGTESNRRHTELQSVALPTELPSHNGPYETRTRDLLRDRQAS